MMKVIMWCTACGHKQEVKDPANTNILICESCRAISDISSGESKRMAHYKLRELGIPFELENGKGTAYSMTPDGMKWSYSATDEWDLLSDGKRVANVFKWSIDEFPYKDSWGVVIVNSGYLQSCNRNAAYSSDFRAKRAALVAVLTNNMEGE